MVSKKDAILYSAAIVIVVLMNVAVQYKSVATAINTRTIKADNARTSVNRDTNDLSEKSVYVSGVETTGSNEDSASLSLCPTGFVYVNDRVLPTNITHDGRAIPKTIHFLLRSRCIPEDLENNLSKWHELMDHSIVYHDEEDVDIFMETVAKTRTDLAGISSAYKCAPNRMAKLDIARFVILWELGGISVDLDSIPGPAFNHGKIIDATDQYIFEEGPNHSRFLASEPKHAALYVSIMQFVTKIDLISSCQDPKEGSCDYMYPGFRRDIYNGKVMAFYDETGDAVGQGKTSRTQNPGFLNSKIVQFNSTQSGDDTPRHLVLPAMDIKNSTMDELNLKVLSSQDRKLHCDPVHKHARKDDPYKVDMQSLIEVVGIAHQNQTNCPKGLVHIPSTYDPKSIVKGRHIPKIIHMTSKSRCFTKKFAKNINRWQFDGYSLFIHDDDAIQRLFDRDWPEFPLLKEIMSCVSSGAGMADVWRYLALFEYGGIYTDIDNAPGDLFANGTVITDEMDSFFEQEKGRFPSQYFLAGTNFSFVQICNV